jgi:hypothetical protein
MSFSNIGKFVLHIITNGEKEKCWHPATITDCFLKEKEYKITYDTFGTCNVHEKDVYFFEDVNGVRHHRNVPVVSTYKEDVLDEDQILLPGWFTVECIRGRRIKNGRVEYLVKWKDFNESENTWERTKWLSQDKMVRGEIKEWLKHQPITTYVAPSSVQVKEEECTDDDTVELYTTAHPTSIATSIPVTPLDNESDFDSSDDEQVEKRQNNKKRRITEYDYLG